MPARHGNRDPRIAPQGVYPCKDEGGRMKDEGRHSPRLHPSSFRLHPSDEWLALSVVTDAQWRALVDLIDDPVLRDPELGTVEGRRRCHDTIDRAIAAWTRTRDKRDAAALLQARGVPAGPVQKTSDLPFDPHLAARGAFHMVRHKRPILGYAAHPHLTTPWRATGRRRAALEDIHDEGEDNRRLLKRWLGLSAAEIRRLEREGALAPVREISVPAQPPPVGAPVFPDFAERLGLPVGR
jgi:crotonobetainyl-CoA:carnitine CoA-transferase CaiB-like acyl-CoA transferase